MLFGPNGVPPYGGLCFGCLSELCYQLKHGLKFINAATTRYALHYNLNNNSYGVGLGNCVTWHPIGKQLPIEPSACNRQRDHKEVK
jgi:hypothetical protein